jgi:hypothetical protein
MILHEIVWLLMSTNLNKYLFGIIRSNTGTLMNLRSCLFCDCIQDEGRPTAGQTFISWRHSAQETVVQSPFLNIFTILPSTTTESSNNMRHFVGLATLLFCGTACAQFASGDFSGMPVMCQNGKSLSFRNQISLLTEILGREPTLTCSEPIQETCGCVCRDGATFNQTRPGSLVDVSWKDIKLPHYPNSYEPSEMYDEVVDVPEDSVFVVADSAQRCQHFEVYVDGEKVGVTNGDGPLDASDCGKAETCIEENGGSHGYFTLQKG